VVPPLPPEAMFSVSITAPSPSPVESTATAALSSPPLESAPLIVPSALSVTLFSVE
jgi:hypothetical protein